MDRQTTGSPPHPSRAWVVVGVIEASVLGLDEDICRISLERGHRTDVLHLRFDELGSSLDRDLEYPAAAGTDADAARAALAGATRSGVFYPRTVLAGGILSAEECQAIIHAGQSAHQRAREEAHGAARAMEAQRPSRILSVARELGLVPEPVGVHRWIANCPGTAHPLMLGTRNETFGCGYCRVIGGPDELRGFVARRRADRAAR